jgi:hypothetical protein
MDCRSLGPAISFLRRWDHAAAPQHFLCFRPPPQGHGSLRPTLGRAGGPAEAACFSRTP